MKNRILYLSYDGMSDPLGQSQVIPYLIGIAQHNGFEIDIISCEKNDRYAAMKDTLSAQFAPYNIQWFPLPFSTNRNFFTRLKDSRLLEKKAMECCRKNQYTLVHCRSYVAAFVGQKLKRNYRIPLLFDMRGFWIDERVEGGLWNLQNPIYRAAYYYYKQKEKSLIQNSDAIVSLTEAGRAEIYQWPCYKKSTRPPIEVIPCSSDFGHFLCTTPARKAQAYDLLQIDPKRRPIISYLGSIGTWYMLEEMMRFFKILQQQQYPNALFLFITKDEHKRIENMAQQIGIAADSLCIKAADRRQIPILLAASDLNVFFIRPTYAKKASSPVKLGEVLACGLPVVANTGVGDIEQIVCHETQSGFLVDDFSDETFAKTVKKIPKLLEKSADDIRQRAEAYYSLDKAVEKYVALYQLLCANDK